MSLTGFEDNHEINEETPFLPNQALPDSNTTRTPVTPLPISQISVLLTAWLAESIISQSISPYLNQLVRELPDVGGDVRKVGYYTGIIVRLTFSKRADVDQIACQVSLHYAAIAATSFQWNRLSDHVGRKPVLLSCLVGTSLSILLFGLSHSFWALVLSRCLHGAVKGHIGAVISTIAELTDETNVARGFSMPPVAWSLGYVIGPLVGGVLSRPQDRWPHIFSHPFWADYPYFLPCLVAATFTCFSFVITALYLEETLNSRPSRLQLPRPNSDTPQGEAGDTSGLDMSPDESQKPLPLRSVLTKPVIITIVNYAMLALIDAMASAYIPLVWSTPVEYGGLNLSPASIGLWLSLYGVMDGIFQFIFFSHFVSRFGLRRVFVFSLVSCAVVYVLFPLENLAVVVGGGPNPVVWLLIILQLLSYCIFDMGFGRFFVPFAHADTHGTHGAGAIYMYTSSAAPNKRSLGAAYGLSQVATSIQNAVGPASADWLFAFSLTHNVLGGRFAYVVLLGVVGVALGVSSQLPKNTWARRKD
ncbi:MFS general substrate transporter [Lactarius hengduanensis]|nr:MFS general substrate transporter [Lactarius hengduanensis]